MPVAPHNRRVVAGAQSEIIRPIGPDDCGKFPTFEQLTTEECGAGRGVTLRYGRAYAVRSTAEIAANCQLLTPQLTTTVPTPIKRNRLFAIVGTGFYDLEGEVHLANANTWEASVTRILQPITSWTPNSITVTQATYPLVGVTVYVYVLNRYGLRNPLGLSKPLIP